MTELLSFWSERVWTFPELLVSRGDTVHVWFPISVQRNEYRQRVIEKAAFLRDYLSDSLESRQLVEHYNGNMILSNLELTSIALQCFSRRTMTSQYLAGDYSYALMGLLRRKPDAEGNDSPFLAFAR